MGAFARKGRSISAIYCAVNTCSTTNCDRVSWMRPALSWAKCCIHAMVATSSGRICSTSTCTARTLQTRNIRKCCIRPGKGLPDPGRANCVGCVCVVSDLERTAYRAHSGKVRWGDPLRGSRHCTPISARDIWTLKAWTYGEWYRTESGARHIRKSQVH